MAAPLTPVTIEKLVALGGVIEDGVNVRFGRQIAYEAAGSWYITSANFRCMEDVIGFLKVYGKSFGFELKEKSK